MRAAELAGSSSYQDLLQVSYGLPGYYFLTCIQFAYPLVGERIEWAASMYIANLALINHLCRPVNFKIIFDAPTSTTYFSLKKN